MFSASLVQRYPEANFYKHVCNAANHVNGTVSRSFASKSFISVNTGRIMDSILVFLFLKKKICIVPFSIDLFHNNIFGILLCFINNMWLGLLKGSTLFFLLLSLSMICWIIVLALCDDTCKKTYRIQRNTEKRKTYH